jgi:hypothetical protein
VCVTNTKPCWSKATVFLDWTTSTIRLIVSMSWNIMSNSSISDQTGFYPVWMTVRHFQVGLVLSRVVPIFYILFAPTGLLFLRNTFLPFFLWRHAISYKKKTDRPFFLRARLRVASNLYKYATNNCNSCYLAVTPTLRTNQPEFKDRRARLNWFHT